MFEFTRIICVLVLAISINNATYSQNDGPAHVFIVAGQSNTDGRVDTKLLPNYIKRMATDTVNYAQGHYKYCKIVQNNSSGKFVPYWPKGRISDGLWTYDAVTYYKLEQALQKDFYVIKYAVGGTSIQYPSDTTKGRFWSANETWLKQTHSYERNGNSLLLSFTESIDAAIDQTLSKLAGGYKIDAFLWHQGESDDKFAGKYYENLKAIIAYVRDHLTQKTGVDYSKLPFVFGSIPKSNRHFKSVIDESMQRISREDPNAFLINMYDGELQKDKTHFTEKSAEYLGTEMFKVLEKQLNLSNTGFRIANYRGDKKCAISYTFDDGLLEHATLAAPHLNKLGFKGTFWVNGKFIDQKDTAIPRISWKQAKAMVRNGNEISNHGWSHKKLTRLTIAEIETEILKNDSAIQHHTGSTPKTFCYPYNSRNDTIEAIASHNRIATRTKQFAIGRQSTQLELDRRIDSLLKEGSWGVAMTHGITYGYDHFVDADLFWNHLKKMKKLENDIWVGTFQQVAAYKKEYDSVTYEIKLTKEGFNVFPFLQLDNKLFDEKLTAVIQKGAHSKYLIKQKGKLIQSKSFSDKVVFDFDPYGGPISIHVKTK